MKQLFHSVIPGLCNHCTHLDLLLGGVLDLRLRGGDPLRGGGDRPNRDALGGEERLSTSRLPLPKLLKLSIII